MSDRHTKWDGTKLSFFEGPHESCFVTTPAPASKLADATRKEYEAMCRRWCALEIEPEDVLEWDAFRRLA